MYPLMKPLYTKFAKIHSISASFISTPCHLNAVASTESLI